uniref:Secreted protein n=1 Tax=Rhizophora mucronata TaxID=61149 RepID=A0A2P2NET2_RHIMU
MNALDSCTSHSLFFLLSCPFLCGFSWNDLTAHCHRIDMCSVSLKSYRIYMNTYLEHTHCIFICNMNENKHDTLFY